jgi:hypothetical protein
MEMGNKFCTNCGTPMDENAVFCPGCGQTADTAGQAADPGYAYTAAQPTEPQGGGYYQQQQPSQPAAPQEGGYYQPQPQQTNAYYQQQPAAPGQGDPYYPPQPPAGGYPYPGYADASYGGQKKGNKGILIGGIIGLIVLAAGIVAAVLLLGKPSASKPGNTANPTGVSAAPASASPSQGMIETPSPASSDVQTDATLDDITGMWEGEMLFTRLEGFDKMPADELPDNFDELLKDMLNEPSPMTFEIREDGGWELYADVELGMWFDSDDFGYGDTSPLLLTDLRNGAFDVSYSEAVDEDDIQGNAAFSLSGTVREDDGELYIQGILLITMKMSDATIVEEAGFRVTYTGPSDSYETDDWDDDNWEDDDADSSASSMDGASLSTNVAPELDDFSWYWDDIFYNGVPYDRNGVETTYDFADMTGGWKGFFYYDPYAEMDALGYELLNIQVSGDESNVTMVLDSYKYYFETDGEEIDTSDDEVLTEYGSYDGWSLQVGKPGFMIYITDFWFYDGVQYAVGYIEFESGEPTYVAMMRP